MMSRVLCRRGVARGALSRAFDADHLLDALKGKDSEHVYAELDSGGWVSAAGGRGAARLCVRAALAPDALCAGALLALCGADLAPCGPRLHAADLAPCGPRLRAADPAPCGPRLRAADLAPCGPRLRLRAAADLAPHAELLLWFAEDALAALDMPFLTPRNVRGREYVCHVCARTFSDPNPLKVHLFLSCAPYEPARFWCEAAARLQAARPTTPPRHPGPAGPLPPAQLEALATEWGRARGGHMCVYCGKLYSRRYGLKIHLRTHTGYRPLRCRHCLRAFGDPSNLNKHERLHAARAGPGAGPGPGPGASPGVGPARYGCQLCGRALARRRDLERHVRTHTQTQTAKQ